MKTIKCIINIIFGAHLYISTNVDMFQYEVGLQLQSNQVSRLAGLCLYF